MIPQRLNPVLIYPTTMKQHSGNSEVLNSVYSKENGRGVVYQQQSSIISWKAEVYKKRLVHYLQSIMPLSLQDSQLLGNPLFFLSTK